MANLFNGSYGSHNYCWTCYNFFYQFCFQFLFNIHTYSLSFQICLKTSNRCVQRNKRVNAGSPLRIGHTPTIILNYKLELRLFISEFNYLENFIIVKPFANTTMISLFYIVDLVLIIFGIYNFISKESDELIFMKNVQLKVLCIYFSKGNLKIYILDIKYRRRSHLV